MIILQLMQFKLQVGADGHTIALIGRYKENEKVIFVIDKGFGYRGMGIDFREPSMNVSELHTDRHGRIRWYQRSSEEMPDNDVSLFNTDNNRTRIESIRFSLKVNDVTVPSVTIVGHFPVTSYSIISIVHNGEFYMHDSLPRRCGLNLDNSGRIVCPRL